MEVNTPEAKHFQKQERTPYFLPCNLLGREIYVTWPISPGRAGFREVAPHQPTRQPRVEEPGFGSAYAKRFGLPESPEAIPFLLALIEWRSRST